MRRIFSYFLPQKVYQSYSSVNGKIELIEQFGKKSIRVENLEQSGPMVEKIWKKGVKEITNDKLLPPKAGPPLAEMTNILILGLGGGSAVRVINKYFPQAKILGIEIDPLMVKLGRKYLGLSEYENLEIRITDAFEWARQACLNDLNLPACPSGRRAGKAGHLNRYDLILVDLYLGRKMPLKMGNEQFLKGIKQLLTSQGVVIFNRLREKRERVKSKKFIDKLRKVYHHIKVVKPVINYLFICR